MKKRRWTIPSGSIFPKEELEADWLSKGEHKQVCNGKEGLTALFLWAHWAGVSRALFEATGMYHRLVETSLAGPGLSLARVTPRQARRVCEGAGLLSKTDRADAAILARMGALLQVKADQPKSQDLRDLKQVSRARQALIKDRPAKDRPAAKARLAATTHRLLSQQIKRRSRQIERDLSHRADLAFSESGSDRPAHSRQSHLALTT